MLFDGSLFLCACLSLSLSLVYMENTYYDDIDLQPMSRLPLYHLLGYEVDTNLFFLFVIFFSYFLFESLKRFINDFDVFFSFFFRSFHLLRLISRVILSFLMRFLYLLSFFADFCQRILRECGRRSRPKWSDIVFRCCKMILLRFCEIVFEAINSSK